MKRKLGQFRISREVLEDFPMAVQHLMSRCIPVRCEHHWGSDQFEYVAISDEFAEVERGAMPPFYHILHEEVRNDKGELIGVLLSFEKERKAA